VASSLRAIIAQRLVRRICDNCQTSYQPTEEELFWLANIDSTAKNISFKQGAGCQNCNQKGYRGRVGVFELLEMTEDMMDALKASDTVAFGHAAKNSPNYAPLASVALSYAKLGLTTVEEVLKLVEMVADSSDKTKQDDNEVAGEDHGAL
jgi:MSHA biogenesis protein MshE